MHRFAYDAESEEEKNFSCLCTFKLRAQFEREQAYKRCSPE